ncbi:MAG: hypothetical protein IH944_01890 [Armatimonadetes bacterium]|nr:hypothetical protein [Armatimonadota bacterium]
MRKLYFAVFVVSLLTVACNKDAEPEPVAAQPDFTGKWEGHTTITDEDIDVMHEMYPEGDRDALERSMRKSQAMVFRLELNEDGTMSMGVIGVAVGMYKGTWELSEDGDLITVSMLSGETITRAGVVDPVTGEIQETERIDPGQPEPMMRLRVVKDGQSLIVTDSVPGAGRITYTRPGTVTMEKYVPDDPFTYAANGDVADFVGEWDMSFEGIDAMWDGMRGMTSEEDVQKMLDEFGSAKGTLQIFDDMTYRMIDGEIVQEGSWTLSEDGATAFLELPVTEEEAAQMEAMGYDMKFELRLTEDRTTLVAHDMTGFRGPIMSFKRQ